METDFQLKERIVSHKQHCLGYLYFLRWALNAKKISKNFQLEWKVVKALLFYNSKNFLILFVLEIQIQFSQTNYRHYFTHHGHG